MRGGGGEGLDAGEVGGEAGGVVGGAEGEDRRLDEAGGHERPDFGDCEVVRPVRVAEGVHPVEGVVVAVVVVDGA